MGFRCDATAQVVTGEGGGGGGLGLGGMLRMGKCYFNGVVGFQPMKTIRIPSFPKWNAPSFLKPVQ